MPAARTERRDYQTDMLGFLLLPDAERRERLGVEAARYLERAREFDDQDGIMDKLGDLVKSYTDVGTGLLDGRKEGLQSTIKLFQDQAAREQRRLDSMESRLRKSLSVMDASVAQSNSTMNFLLGL